MGFLPDPLHPALVHFPIALSIVAVLLELLARHPRLRSLGGAAGLVMALAAAGSVAAVLSGEAAHDEAVIPAAAAALVARHEDVGELAMWLLLGVVALRLLLAWRGWLVRWGAWLYLAAAVAATAAVGYNGYLGGKMVFDHGVGTAPVQRGAAAAAPAAAVGSGR
ncbi:MAG: hypothetical protein EPN53_01305 [Acidobacteria bacterium]|nr:MAG: hypothetical protein EPN53_01305 [Acidobacteriota bacterium]